MYFPVDLSHKCVSVSEFIHFIIWRLSKVKGQRLALLQFSCFTQKLCMCAAFLPVRVFITSPRWGWGHSHAAITGDESPHMDSEGGGEGSLGGVATRDSNRQRSDKMDGLLVKSVLPNEGLSKQKISPPWARNLSSWKATGEWGRVPSLTQLPNLITSHEKQTLFDRKHKHICENVPIVARCLYFMLSRRFTAGLCTGERGRTFIHWRVCVISDSTWRRRCRSGMCHSLTPPPGQCSYFVMM